MGACASKPKVLGDKARPRSKKWHPLSRSYTTVESPSSLTDEKGSISFSHYKDHDFVIAPKDEVEDVDSYTGTSNHYVHQEELPSYDDDDLDNHDPSTKEEVEEIKIAITKAIEQSKNDVVEVSESSDATKAVGLQLQSDVVEVAKSSPVTQNDIVVSPHHASEDAMSGPTQSDYVVDDLVIKGEDNVINTNNIPSTFAF